MASECLEAELARLLGEIAALFRREPRAELQAGQAGGAGGEAERLRASLEVTADRLAQAAARFERLGLDAAAATVRLVEREARDALREFCASGDGSSRRPAAAAGAAPARPGWSRS
jgi:hypothetical protein